MASGTLVFRASREGDEAAILRALNATSATGGTLDEWAWLFPPEEGGRAIVVGERDGDVVALCAGTPARVAAEGREWAAVELRKLLASGIDDADRILRHFVETFLSNGRFDVAIAAFNSSATIATGFTRTAHPRLSVLVRTRPTAAPIGRLLYRAEPARDWEPQLDGLWRRARSSYPVAVVRDADRALRRFAAHPRVRHHRFLVFPRFSSRAVASAVFSTDSDRCRWLDLLWDHDHPGALELLAHISGRLARQVGCAGEELWLAGDDETRSVLTRRGFGRGEDSALSVLAARSSVPEFDSTNFVEHAYMTLADVEGFLFL